MTSAKHCSPEVLTKQVSEGVTVQSTILSTAHYKWKNISGFGLESNISDVTQDLDALRSNYHTIKCIYIYPVICAGDRIGIRMYRTMYPHIVH